MMADLAAMLVDQPVALWRHAHSEVIQITGPYLASSANITGTSFEQHVSAGAAVLS
jgi:hypothetical protein